MANDNAQGAQPFAPGSQPPTGQPQGWFPEDGLEADGGNEPDPLGPRPGITDVNYTAVSGTPHPNGKSTDTYVNIPGDGITPG